MSHPSNIKALCLRLMAADTEAGVVHALETAGYWEDPSAWRYIGDNPNNFSTIGNQQSRPEAALVEKLVNAVDARLINAALERGIAVDSAAAPRSIREAVALFFEGASPPVRAHAGRIHNWPDSKRTEEARLITLSATGHKPEQGFPCLSIADRGSGQTPNAFSRTFLSLHSENKLKVHFVQGKFNMGGTGALRFCGRHNLQLIVSRRNPKILHASTSDDDLCWGFTVVRREDPSGGRRSSAYTYLAPLPSIEENGGVLRFHAATMPLFPQRKNAYARDAEWGSLIKLYEYESKGFRSNIITSGGGLLRRIDLLLPEVALPIRLYECRDYRGHRGSFETNVSGIAVRLADDRADNLEEGFPTSGSLNIHGQKMPVKIYAFRKGRAEDYRLNQGVLFSVNGQAHADFPVDYFRRKSVGMSYLRDSLFVTVDCSAVDGRVREDLFMNSRDRLADGPMKTTIESELAQMLKHHAMLRALLNERRQQEIAERLEDSKPLEDVLRSLMERSPTLAKLFLLGERIPNPFVPESAKSEQKKYKGRRFPTYLRFRGKKYGHVQRRNVHLQQRPRVLFETDATNDYFHRDVDPGQANLLRGTGEAWTPVATFNINLHDGSATLSFPLPSDVRVGDRVKYRLIVGDVTSVEPFLNEFELRIKRSQKKTARSGAGRRNPPSREKGHDRDTTSLLALPHITPVCQEKWSDYSPAFDRFTALRIRHVSTDDNSAEGDPADAYDFFVNVDNLYLKTEQKRSTEPAELMEQRFMYAMVLAGLSLLQDSRTRPGPKDDEDLQEDRVEDRVESITRALAPVLLPMIETLGSHRLADR